jgi:hypothetical protein
MSNQNVICEDGAVGYVMFNVTKYMKNHGFEILNEAWNQIQSSIVNVLMGGGANEIQ